MDSTNTQYEKFLVCFIAYLIEKYNITDDDISYFSKKASERMIFNDHNVEAKKIVNEIFGLR